MVSPNSYTRQFRRILNSQPKGGDIPPQAIFAIMWHNGGGDAGGLGGGEELKCTGKKGGKKAIICTSKAKTAVLHLYFLLLYIDNTSILPAE